MVGKQANQSRRRFLGGVAAVTAGAWVADWSARRLVGQEPIVRKLAFLIGVSKYDKRGTTNLSYAEKDMLALRDELKKQGFDVHLMLGSYKAEDPNRATRDNLRVQLQNTWLPALKKLNKPDIALIAMSGHGCQQTVRKASGEIHDDQFFCPVDATLEQDRPDPTNLRYDVTTLLSVSELMKQLSSASGCDNNLVLVDACRNNASKGGVDGAVIQQLDPGLAMLFGARAGTRSWESDKLEHGVFSYYLLEGLRGKAADADGEVTWDSLVNHVKKQVAKKAPELVSQSQLPNSIANLHGASPVLARIDRGAQPPAPTPPSPGNTPPSNLKPGAERSDNGLQLKLLYCPPGKFTMGSPLSDPDRSKDEGPVEVTLSRGFWLGKYEVTQREWERVMGTTPWKGKLYVKEGANYPATYVSHSDATEFCRKLTASERQAGLLGAGETYRLPTEAEWEYACRAGTTTRYSFGDDAGRLKEYGWFDANADDVGEDYSHQVGQKLPNNWGLCDMHGNVWEWCADWYQEELSGGLDPVVSQGASSRVARGGSWDYSAWFCRSAFRIRLGASLADYDLGFRLALSPSGR